MSAVKSKRGGGGGLSWQVSAPYILAVVFFFVLCLCSAGTVRVCGMVLIIGTLIAGALRFRLLTERVSVPLLALLLVTVMGGISTLYAMSGKFALQEFLKMLCAVCVALLLTALSPKRETCPGRFMAVILAGAAALAGLVSIDLLSTHLFSGLVLGILGLFTGDYQDLLGVEAGVRMTSLFINPNVFAGCVGIGALLSLGLAVTADSPRQRNAAICLLFVNSLAFLLAFSMGATAMLGLAFLVYFLLERPERRGGLLVLMMETLVLVVLAVIPVYLTAFQGWTGFQPVPLLVTVGGAVLLCLLDRFVGERLSARLSRAGRRLPLIFLALMVLLAVILVLAVSVKGPATYSAASGLRRAAYPAPGNYTLTVSASGPVQVSIESQNRQDTMMHTSTVIYDGPADQAAFTVPEDSIVCYFNFFAEEGTRIESVSYGTGNVPLGYPLLPGFIANRLQGILANQNAIQRVVFFSDGLKLFAASPVFGRGLGGFENGIKSVQSFYYETKYAHNHYIQALCDMGIVGLALFLAMLVVTAVCIWRERKRENANPLSPMLGACLLFMAGHAAVEVVFSSYPYLPLAYGVIALAGMTCGESWKVPDGAVRRFSLLGFGGLTVAFAVLLGGNLAAKNIVSTRSVTLPALEEAINLDRYEWADYMLSYVNAVAQNPTDLAQYTAQADEYAQRLSRLDSNTVPYYLLVYYYNTGRTEEAFAMAEKYVSYVASDAAGWQKVFDLLVSATPQSWDDPAFRAGIRSLGDRLQAWNDANMGAITLSPEAMELIARAGE